MKVKTAAGLVVILVLILTGCGLSGSSSSQSSKTSSAKYSAGSGSKSQHFPCFQAPIGRFKISILQMKMENLSVFLI